MKTLLLLLLLLPSCTDVAYAQAVWNGRSYSSPVCANPNCAMCQSIRSQLTAQTYATIVPAAYVSAPSTAVDAVEYETVQVPVVTQVKRCNGITCWYENVTTYRTERRPVQRAVQAVRNVVDAVTPRVNMLTNTEFAPTPFEAVIRMVQLANPMESDVLYDLGCGDGRVLITASSAYRCRSVGIELNPKTAQVARDAVGVFRLGDRVRVYDGNILNYDNLPEATVVTMYLYPELMQRVLAKLRPGVRVVSYLHEIPGGERHVFGEHVFYTWTVK